MADLQSLSIETAATSLEVQMQKELECPVCLSIPRELPIPCCPVGHILCIPCRSGVQDFPTCRRQLGDNVSSLAAAMIEKINHLCKYSGYGCSYQEKLPYLVAHETCCPERTIKCPREACEEETPIKDFLSHAKSKHYCALMDGQKNLTLSASDIQWDGVALRNGEEFDLESNIYWPYQYIEKHECIFFFVSRYDARNKMFLFNIMVQGGSEEANKFMAIIKLVNDEKKILMFFKGPVLHLDKFPSNSEHLMENPGCFCVHYKGMRNIFTVDDKGENMCRPRFSVKVEITKD